MLDFSLVKPDYLKLLTSVDLKMKEGKLTGKYEKMQDAGFQFLDSVSPIRSTEETRIPGRYNKDRKNSTQVHR